MCLTHAMEILLEDGGIIRKGITSAVDFSRLVQIKRGTESYLTNLR